jgi:hypothetical protein
MLYVRAVQRIRIEKNGKRVFESDSVFRRVSLRLSRVPFEHLFSIYIT